MIILASASATRAAMLRAAGVAFEAVPAPLDEDELKASLRAAGLSPRDQADALAEAKARAVARRTGGTVLGSDQVLEGPDGAAWDSARGEQEMREHLRALSGATHRLHSAAVACRDGEPVWRHVETVRLTVRPLTDAFIDSYIAAELADGAGKGTYRIEQRGAQLFTRIDGSHFAVLGMPLLPLLMWLRDTGEMPA